MQFLFQSLKQMKGFLPFQEIDGGVLGEASK